MFTTEDIIALANKMGHIAASVGSRLFFLVPPYRTDVISGRDIIEDIAMAFGYDRIIPARVVGASVGVPDELAEDSETACAALMGMGFSEALNTLLTNEPQCFEMVGRKYNKGSDGEGRLREDRDAVGAQGLDTAVPAGQPFGVDCRPPMPQRLLEVGSVFRVEGGKVAEARNAAIVTEHSRSNFSEIRPRCSRSWRAVAQSP